MSPDSLVFPYEKTTYLLWVTTGYASDLGKMLSYIWKWRHKCVINLLLVLPKWFCISLKQPRQVLVDSCTCGTIPSPCVKISLSLGKNLWPKYILQWSHSLWAFIYFHILLFTTTGQFKQKFLSCHHNIYYNNCQVSIPFVIFIWQLKQI